MHFNKAILSKVYFGVVFLWILIIAQIPGQNWDMIGYIGVVLDYELDDVTQIHQQTYETVRKEVSPEKFNALANSNEHVKRLSSDPDFFYKELNFFRVKPLYTFSIYVLNKFGIKLTTASHIPSLAACFGLLILCFYWMKKEIDLKIAFFIGVGLLFFYPLILLGRLSTPDALSNFITLAVFFGLYYQIKKRWLLLLLLALLLTRIDNIIFAGIILAFLLVKEYSLENAFKFFRYLLGIGLIAAVFLWLFPYIIGNSADWLLNFKHTFSLGHYLTEVKGLPKEVIFETSFPLFIILFLLSYQKLLKPFHFLIFISFLTILIRIILFPSFQERFFVAFELLILIAVSISINKKEDVSITPP